MKINKKLLNKKAMQEELAFCKNYVNHKNNGRRNRKPYNFTQSWLTSVNMTWATNNNSVNNTVAEQNKEGGNNMFNTIKSLKDRFCWDVFTDTWSVVSIGSSAYTEYAKLNNIPADAIVKLMTRWTKNDPRSSENPKVVEAQARLDKICQERSFVTPNGNTYELLGRGASDIRQADSLWVDKRYHKMIENFMYLGRQGLLREVLAQSKYEIYGTLALSTSKTYEEAYGPFADLMKPWNIRNAVVVPDVEANTVACAMDAIGTDDVLHLNQNMSVLDKKSDGLIYHIVRSNSKHIRDHSVRMNLVKGLKHHIERNCWIRTLQSLGKWTVKDVWGKEHDLRTVELVIFASAFKGYKGFESWDDYINCCKVYKCNQMRVCVDCKHAIANFPTQQVRGLHMLPDFMGKAVDYNVYIMENYMTVDGAPSLVGGILGKISAACPEFMNTVLMRKTLQGAWATRMSQLLGGAFLNVSTYQFVINDVLPTICKLVGAEEIRLIKSGNLHTSLTSVGTRVIATRAPMPGSNYALLVNQEVPEKYAGLYIGGSVVLNWDDPLMILFQCDFDGDKLNLVFVDSEFKSLLWEACASAIKRYDYRPLFFENNTPKTKWTVEGAYESVRTTDAAPIGIFDDAITKLCGAWEKFYKDNAFSQFRRDSAYLEKEVTVCVDNAKNGGEPGKTAAAIVAKIQDAKLKKDRCYAFKHTSLNNANEYAAECGKSKYGVVMTDPVAMFSLACAMRLPEVYTVDAPEWTKMSYKVFTVGDTKLVINGLLSFQDEEHSIWHKVIRFVKDNTRKDEEGNVFDRKDLIEEAKTLFWKLCDERNASEATHDQILNQLIMRCFTPNGAERSVLDFRIEEVQRLCVEMFGVEMFDRLIVNTAE